MAPFVPPCCAAGAVIVGCCRCPASYMVHDAAARAHAWNRPGPADTAPLALARAVNTAHRRLGVTQRGAQWRQLRAAVAITGSVKARQGQGGRLLARQEAIAAVACPSASAVIASPTPPGAGMQTSRALRRPWTSTGTAARLSPPRRHARSLGSGNVVGGVPLLQPALL